jgi:hypothetical protein
MSVMLLLLPSGSYIGRAIGLDLRGCIQRFPDWPPGARTVNGTALCHYVQLYRYFVSQSSEFFPHNALCCFSTCNTKGKRIFRFQLSPETFGYTLVLFVVLMSVTERVWKHIVGQYASGKGDTWKDYR